MSIQTNGIIKSKSGQINLIDRFLEQMASLCASSNYSDVTLIVQNQRFSAHRNILAARSEYFRALLYGGLAESSQSEIELKMPYEYEIFQVLLQYMYSGYMALSEINEDKIIDILGLANQYVLTDLEFSICEYLKEIISIDNVCTILDHSHLYGYHHLTDVCHTFIDQNASELLSHSTFKTLSQKSLCNLLDRDTFFAEEFQIFTAVNLWRDHNAHIDIAGVNEVLSRIRIHLMDWDVIFKKVRPLKIFDADRLFEAIEMKTMAKSLNHRSLLLPKENIASDKYGARTIKGRCRSELLNGDITSYSGVKGYTSHAIVDTNGTNDTNIIIELGSRSMINHIRILLWDRDTRSYSYFVEVSSNQLQWDRVADHSQYNCRSWQNLYFHARSVKFIKLVGTHNTENNEFHVVSLQAMYVESIPPLINGLVSPTYNAATFEMGAKVIEGTDGNELLNGNMTDYSPHSGYTSHVIGRNTILIQLGQPYYIGSLRLLLWDGDDRTYGFYIETSTNQNDWEMAIDNRNEYQRSWQSYTFNARPVIFIKIVGTYNSDNGNTSFHCGHFECPSQDGDLF